MPPDFDWPRLFAADKDGTKASHAQARHVVVSKPEAIFALRETGGEYVTVTFGWLSYSNRITTLQ